MSLTKLSLHSALTQGRVEGRTDEEKRTIFRFERIDVMIAMAIAGTINARIVEEGGLTGVADIDKAFEQLRVLEGNIPAILFGLALLTSGFSSSSVGTMSGQVVMQGFINRRIPPLPPHITFEQAKGMMFAIVKRDPAAGVIKQYIKGVADEFLPHRSR